MDSRNSNAHFATLPSVGVQRSILNRNFEHKLTGNVGDVIPIYWDEMLPGDTLSIDLSEVIRFQTMLSPVMDNMYADIMFFSTRNALLWDHWENFMGETSASAWTPQTTYTIPQIKVPPTGSGSNNYVGSILDYLGFPVEMPIASGSYEEVSALPVRCYSKICDDWFRSEWVTDPLNYYTGDSAVIASTQASYVNDVPLGGAPYKASKFRDFFTSCLPSPQRGADVLLPLGNKAPVFAGTAEIPSSLLGEPIVVYNGSTGIQKYSFMYSGAADWSSNASVNRYTGYDSQLAAIAGYGTTGTGAKMSPSNLWTDLSSATAATVNDIRFAFQLQKLLEKDARGGGRYKEIIKSHFNVDTPDARLFRSEYLGGKRIPINISQVTNNAQTSSDPLGDLGAYSLTTDVHSYFTKSFTEHCHVMGVMVIRTDKTYSQGVMPKWRRKSRFDYYWPVFSNIGEQPVPKSAMYLGATGTFGYQEAWADYRFNPNSCAGEMRPYVSNNLGSWSFADDYNSAPSLSDAWIREDKANVDRTLAVTSATSHQFWADFWFKIRHARPMPVYSVPGLIDHH